MTSIRDIMILIIRDLTNKNFKTVDNEFFVRFNLKNTMAYEIEKTKFDIRIYNDKSFLISTIKSVNDWHIFREKEFKIIDEIFENN